MKSKARSEEDTVIGNAHLSSLIAGGRGSPRRMCPCRAAGGVLLASLIVLVVAGLAACQETRTSSLNRPLPPKPRRLPRVPADARADALVLNLAATSLDTNGNGYPDLIHATAYLFDRRYPPAIYEEGAFVFLVFPTGQTGAGADPLHRWRIEGAELQRARAPSAFGQSYRFRLSLLDDGTDVLPMSMVDIVTRFEPADGRDPVYAGEVSSIQLGRRVVLPQLKWHEETEPTVTVDGP